MVTAGASSVLPGLTTKLAGIGVAKAAVVALAATVVVTAEARLSTRTTPRKADSARGYPLSRLRCLPARLRWGWSPTRWLRRVGRWSRATALIILPGCAAEPCCSRSESQRPAWPFRLRLRVTPGQVVCRATPGSWAAIRDSAGQRPPIRLRRSRPRDIDQDFDPGGSEAGRRTSAFWPRLGEKAASVAGQTTKPERSIAGLAPRQARSVRPAQEASRLSETERRSHGAVRQPGASSRADRPRD